MCGGRVLVVPCSRVGHVFRMRRPYNSKSKVAGGDTQLYNSVRVAKVWLDEESLVSSNFDFRVQIKEYRRHKIMKTLPEIYFKK